MKFLELLARKAGMHEVLLTVMKGNASAAAMYAKLGYVEHEDQPEAPEGEEAPSYSILTKRLAAEAGAAARDKLVAAGESHLRPQLHRLKALLDMEAE